MDDKEYYSLMNRKSSWLLQQNLKKKNNEDDMWESKLNRLPHIFIDLDKYNFIDYYNYKLVTRKILTYKILTCKILKLYAGCWTV